MNILKKIRNYICYCGIEKDEYNAVKKNAYISNFEVWRVLHFVMDIAFGFMLVNSMISNLLEGNMIFYLAAFIYSIIATGLFFVVKSDSFVGQLLIYLSIIMLLLFGCFLTSNNPSIPALTFIVMLIITPLFMIDKPYYMILVIILSATVFLIWMYNVKDVEIWKMDLVNTCAFAGVAIIIHVIANSIRIKEFVLIKEIQIQKDTDDMTGLMNKGALTRNINEFLSENTSKKAMLIFLDIDYFKPINDTYGHDVGDSVINQLGKYLAGKFTNSEIVGRFGGDEFIVFIKDSDDTEYARKVALEIWEESREFIKLPNPDHLISVSMGIAVYHGEEKNYSEIFKKADVALYVTKANRDMKYSINY